MERRYSAVDIGSRRVLAPKSFGSQHEKKIRLSGIPYFTDRHWII
jgi:hypothetical protein